MCIDRSPLIKSGRSFSNHETVALDDVLASVFNKDMGLHFLTYFPDTFFGSLAIKKRYLSSIFILVGSRKNIR